jgi:hypothetical protein
MNDKSQVKKHIRTDEKTPRPHHHRKRVEGHINRLDKVDTKPSWDQLPSRIRNAVLS